MSKLHQLIAIETNSINGETVKSRNSSLVDIHTRSSASKSYLRPNLYFQFLNQSRVKNMNQLKQQELRYILNSDSFSRKESIKIIPTVLIIALASPVLLLAR